MPIIISEKPQHAAFYDRLTQAGVRTIGHEEAEDQIIRPARIGLLNLMPESAMAATEIQWFRYISRTLLQIEAIPIKFDNDVREREGGARAARLAHYTSFSKAMKKGLDAIIVTGDNRELDTDGATRRHLPLDKIRYLPQLHDVLQQADEEIALGVYSCLGAHIALNEFHSIERAPIGPRKVSGVFEHDVIDPDDPFTRHLNSTIWAPHSRHGRVDTADLRADPNVKLLADNDEIGWLLARSGRSGSTNTRLFFQGHPEYDDLDLHSEYQRDVLLDPSTEEPRNYYDKHGNIIVRWRTDARAIHTNMIDAVYDSYAPAA